MPLIKIRGRVYPTGVTINTRQFDLNWVEGTGQPPIRFVIVVVNSYVSIECTMESYDPKGNHSLYTTRGLELARAIVDPIGFAQGVGLFIVLEELVTPRGVRLKIVGENKALQPLATAFKDDFDAVQRLVVEDPLIYLAMNELIVAITLPGQITINCGRAIEALRRIMVPVDPTRKLGWAMMQDMLNFERSYREYITNASTNPRHGCRDGIAADVAQDILERSWTIMNRFIEYRKRGNTKLPLDPFVMLS